MSSARSRRRAIVINKDLLADALNGGDSDETAASTSEAAAPVEDSGSKPSSSSSSSFFNTGLDSPVNPNPPASRLAHDKVEVKSSRAAPIESSALSALMEMMGDDDMDVESLQAALALNGDESSPVVVPSTTPSPPPSSQPSSSEGASGSLLAEKEPVKACAAIIPGSHSSGRASLPGNHSSSHGVFVGNHRASLMPFANSSQSHTRDSSKRPHSMAPSAMDTMKEEKDEKVQTKGSKEQKDIYETYLDQAKKENFSDLDLLQFLYKSGKDSEGRDIIVVIGCNIPARLVSLDRLFLYAINKLDEVVEKEYVLVYLAANQSSSNRPSFKWLKKMYSVFNRKYKKNLKKLYIIKPSHWIKLMLSCFKPFVSSKFWAKVIQMNEVANIYGYLNPNQLKFPPTVIEAISLSRPLFGVSLDEAMKNSKHVKDGLPIVVTDCMHYIYDHGLDVEGIFRIPGDKTLMNELRASYDSGDSVNFSTNDPNTVASLMKMYLRDLPEPLIPESLYDPLLQVHKDKSLDQQELLNRMKTLLEGLPPLNTVVLREVCVFAHELTLHQEKNMMTVENVSLCFAPTLMWRSTTLDPVSMLQEMASVNSVIKTIIENHPVVLPGGKPLITPPSQVSTASKLATVAGSASSTITTTTASSPSNRMAKGRVKPHGPPPSRPPPVRPLPSSSPVPQPSSSPSEESSPPAIGPHRPAPPVPVPPESSAS